LPYIYDRYILIDNFVIFLHNNTKLLLKKSKNIIDETKRINRGGGCGGINNCGLDTQNQTNQIKYKLTT
jgi:hypothetical protein